LQEQQLKDAQAQKIGSFFAEFCAAHIATSRLAGVRVCRLARKPPSPSARRCRQLHSFGGELSH